MSNVTDITIRVNIRAWSAWLSGCSIDELKGWAKGTEALPAQPEVWPVPQKVPKGQQRRLSPMAKMVLAQLDKIDNVGQLPSVFSTRHGDLPKTVALVSDVANREPLSPTQFTLSVHNAIAGQYGIYWGNTHSCNLVSGGRDSFHLGLLDAAMRLNYSPAEEMLFIHADLPLPKPYEQHSDEQQMAHCVVLVLSKACCALKFDVKRLTETQQSSQHESLPHAVQFLKSMINDQRKFLIQGDANWAWQRG